MIEDSRRTWALAQGLSRSPGPLCGSFFCGRAALPSGLLRTEFSPKGLVLCKRKSNVRWLAVTAILGAVAAVLMMLSISVPIIPSFVKLDFSELPALIAAFAMGPVSGVGVCLIKNLVNLPTSYSAGIGELCNFLLGVAFVLPAGLFYKF